jgi:hypothetical protein
MKTILVLAANPVDTSRLRLDEEIREITEGLRRASNRDDYVLRPVLAARPDDVRRAMLETRPSIVHFCGHGSASGGIAFEDHSGQSRLVTAEALSGFFRLFADQVDCVVLNACYSESQANAIAQHINHVVGMHGRVDDAKAIKFAVAFYDALGAGRELEFAYELALNATQWEQGGEALRPTLKSKGARAAVVSSGAQITKDTLERNLQTALSAYKGQPEVFIEPTVTKEREPDDDQNILMELIVTPSSSLVLAQPQFGQTCLCHYMRLEAYKRGTFWAYVDAKHIKTRKVLDFIQEQHVSAGATTQRPDCILIDSWNGSIIDHANMLKCLDVEFPDTPILVMINYTEPTFGGDFDFSKLKHAFQVTHLQPLRRIRVRELITKYGEARHIPTNDAVVTKVVRDLAALNVHRTPLNCLTLLRVFEKNWSEEIVNRTRLIKALLFILFTDAESFTYATSKPDVDDCEYILGKFCKGLIERGTTTFRRPELLRSLHDYCQEKLIAVDVAVVVDILESNNILLRFGENLEFRHSYWIFYFAATYMLHDPEFAARILENRRYVNFPEIIEFYTGCDGRRVDAVETLIADTGALVDTVDGKIGIPEQFNPYEGIVWNPSDEAVEAMRAEVSKKVEESTLPTEIKDRHADQTYDVSAPYNQSIRQFLHEYSVISLMQAMKAASRALRNSKYVDPELKREMLRCVVKGWASMARVIFILAPTLAHRGRAAYDGFGLILGEGFYGSYQKKLKDILLAGPFNVVRYLKDDLSSGKIGPLIAALLTSKIPDIQKHFLAHFLIRERPEGWYQAVSQYMNLLHRNSFYLWDLSGAVHSELSLGFTTPEESRQLKLLTEIVLAKHVEGPRKRALGASTLPRRQAISERNRLPIDKIRAAARRQQSGPQQQKAAGGTGDGQQSPSDDFGKAAADADPTEAPEG